jgi:hypothetical protein
MNYLTAMGNVLTFEPFHLNASDRLKQLQAYSIINVLILGLIYGCSAALFSQSLLAGRGLPSDAFNPVKIIVAGIPVAFFIHAGAALFIWVFLKALGGKSDFVTSYFCMGAAAISLWPLAPFVAVLQLGSQSGLLLLFTGVFCLYGFAVNFLVIKQVFHLSLVRMTLATTVSLVYITCFLYLWV